MYNVLMIDDDVPSPADLRIIQVLGKRRILGDVTNNHASLKSMLADQGLWSEIKPIPTYDGYLKENKPTEADALSAASDRALVSEYDAAVQEINREIGAGVISTEQATRVRAAIEKAQKVISGK